MTRPGERWVKDADPAEQVSVTLLLRPPADQAQRLLAGEPYTSNAAEHDQRSLDAAHAFAREHNLTVASEDPASRRIVYTGTAQQMEHAFGVQLGQVQDQTGRIFRTFRGELEAPPFATAVLGLDERPVARHAGGR